MANLRVGTGITFDGATGNFNTLGIGTVRGGFPDGFSVGTAATIHANGNVTCGIITTTNIVNETQLSHRNLVINGAMQVSQRGQVANVGGTGGSAGAGFGGPDRFQFNSNYSVVTMSQSTDVPSGQGFAKSLKMDVTTAGGDSNASTYTQIDYRFEGQELTRLKYGTSSAETTTLCFWIKSPKTGTHWVRLYGDELTNNAFISRKYTVSSANTWQKVTLHFPAYTTSGFNNDNTTGMRITWYFAQGSTYSSGTAQADDGDWLEWIDAGDRARNTVGQVNCFDSTDNDIFLTGVQFEVGSEATPFEHRQFGEEMALCKRYYNRVFDAEGQSGELPASLAVYETNSAVTTTFNFPKMRVVPSLEITNGTNKFMVRSNSVSDHFDTMSFRYGTTQTAEIVASSGVSGTAGYGGFLRSADTDVYIAFSAEL